MNANVKETLGEALQRFAAVMAARKTTQDLLGLFEKLAVSDKFLNKHKSACFGRLIKMAMSRIERDEQKRKGYARLVYDAALHVPDEQVFTLLAAIEHTQASAEIYKGYTVDRVLKIMGPMVRRLIEQTPKTEEDLAAIFHRLIQCGVARQRVDVICMLLEGGMAEADVDPICDLTHHMEYGRTSKPAPQFEPELI